MQVNTEQAKEFIIDCMKQKLACFLHSSPGIGKSAIVQQIADQFNLFLLDVRLSQCDSLDMNGMIQVKNNRGSYAPMDIWPIDGDPIPKGYTGFLLFLDEMNAAPLSVQSASYKLVLDRMAGGKHLHKKMAIVCAGNLVTDKAIVSKLSTAMQSRLVHIELGVDHETWLKWAGQAHIDHRIMAYINNCPQNLFKFDPNHNDKTFPCPRTYEFLSRFTKDVATEDLNSKMALFAGTVGEAIAREFVVYSSIYKEIPTFQEIIALPSNTAVSETPAILYALSHMIAANVKSANIDKVMEYVNRMPIEFATITLQNIVRRDKSFIKNDSIQLWFKEKGEELF